MSNPTFKMTLADDCDREPTVADLEREIANLYELAWPAIHALKAVLARAPEVTNGGAIKLSALLAFMGQSPCEMYKGHRSDAMRWMHSAAETHGPLTPDHWKIGGRSGRRNELRFDVMMSLRVIGHMTLAMWPNGILRDEETGEAVRDSKNRLVRHPLAESALEALMTAHECVTKILELTDALNVTIDPRMGTIEPKA